MDALCLSHTKWEEHFFSSQYVKWEYLTLGGGTKERIRAPRVHLSNLRTRRAYREVKGVMRREEEKEKRGLQFVDCRVKLQGYNL